MISKGAFHLSGLTDQNITIMRISLLIKIIQSEQSNHKNYTPRRWVFS